MSASQNGAGLRVLVVEDEAMIAFYIEDCLTDLGHKVVGPVSRVAKALSLIESESFDVALLDINVAGEQVYPAAEALKSRHIPFVFLSGYGSSGLTGEWKGSTMLEKPFVRDSLKAKIDGAMRGAG